MTLKRDLDDMLDPILKTLGGSLKTVIVGRLMDIYISGSVQMMEWAGVPYEGPPMAEAIKYAEKQGAKLVTQMDEETKRRLAKVISDGIEQKRGVPGLGRDLRSTFGDMTKNRSRAIARTETNIALSDSSFERMHDLGIDGKEWVTVGDDKVRPEHLANEAAGIIPIDQAFPSGDMHPPGVDGVNCRCVLAPARLPRK